MKIASKFSACTTIALLMASCGNPVDNAAKAIENGDYVEAAKSITKLSVEDINDMSAEEQLKVRAVGAAIEMSGNEEASKILYDNINLNEIEQKEIESLDALKDIF